MTISSNPSCSTSIFETWNNLCGSPSVNTDNDVLPPDNDDSTTLIDSFLARSKVEPEEIFLTQPMGFGKVRTWTFEQVHQEALQVAAYLSSLNNLPPKSQVATMSKNCAWWIIADLGIFLSGHVSVPVYPTLTAESTQHILEHSEAKLLFVGKIDDGSWQEMKNGIPTGLSTVSFPLSPGPDCAQLSWEETVSKHRPLKTPTIPKPEDMATIMYTSGSTGKSKGVMMNFKAWTVSCRSIQKLLNVTPRDRWLSYLPLAHAAERFAGEGLTLVSGVRVFFAESLSTFLADLNRARPTLFLSVPRLYTKFQLGIYSKMDPDKLNLLLKVPIVNLLVRQKILGRTGLNLDCVRYAGVGSAPCPPQLISWYRSLGMELMEGYGMTENFCYSHATRPGKFRPGYVGQPYDGVERRISEQGEILVKSPGNMMGYYKNPEATKECLSDDGWLATGDKGEIDGEGRLKITGRVKELFKNSKGKYVAPAPIENQFVAHHLVEMACVTGAGYPSAYAIVQLAEDQKKKAAGSDAEKERIAGILTHYMEQVNETLDPHERLAFLVLVRDEWLPQNGLLTPTQKMQRGKIEATYKDHVDAWYEQKKKLIWHG